VILASSLELCLLVLVSSSHDLRTKVLGTLVWVCYFPYSASRALLEQVAQWLHDRNNPPPGAA
jgi:hypothetical protein